MKKRETEVEEDEDEEAWRFWEGFDFGPLKEKEKRKQTMRIFSGHLKRRSRRKRWRREKMNWGGCGRVMCHAHDLVYFVLFSFFFLSFGYKRHGPISLDRSESLWPNSSVFSVLYLFHEFFLNYLIPAK